MNLRDPKPVIAYLDGEPILANFLASIHLDPQVASEWPKEWELLMSIVQTYRATISKLNNLCKIEHAQNTTNASVS